jgi:hypothetical protein
MHDVKRKHKRPSHGLLFTEVETEVIKQVYQKQSYHFYGVSVLTVCSLLCAAGSVMSGDPSRKMQANLYMGICGSMTLAGTVYAVVSGIRDIFYLRNIRQRAMQRAAQRRQMTEMLHGSQEITSEGCQLDQAQRIRHLSNGK